MTTPPKIYKTEAIVLKHLAFGEADYLLTLYTPNEGKLRAVVKGARRVKSKLGGHLEPLMRTSLLITRGQNLDTINQAEVLDGHRAVREDLDRLSQAIYMMELVDAITPEEQPNYPIYLLLLDTMRSLTEGASPLLLVSWDTAGSCRSCTNVWSVPQPLYLVSIVSFQAEGEASATPAIRSMCPFYRSPWTHSRCYASCRRKSTLAGWRGSIWSRERWWSWSGCWRP